MGYGQEYRYAHDEPNAYAAGEEYFPQEMAQTRYQVSFSPILPSRPLFVG
jgi:replication-associated recombination protein RarA